MYVLTRTGRLIGHWELEDQLPYLVTHGFIMVSRWETARQQYVIWEEQNHQSQAEVIAAVNKFASFGLNLLENEHVSNVGVQIFFGKTN